MGVALLCMFGTGARAQSTATDSTREVLLLMAERVENAPQIEAEGPTGVHFWWESAQGAQWSESDRLIRQGLSARGVGVKEPAQGASISKIYRRANLSQANAAALGSLLGAGRVLVGTLDYTREAPVGLVGLKRVSARADVSLLATRGSTTVLQHFTVRREGFAPTEKEALEAARQELSRAFSRVVSAALLRGAGPVGVERGEQLIGLHNAQNGQVLQQVTQFLKGLDVVDEVQIRWVSEGLIALEINPQKADEPGSIEFAIRALSSEPFEAFSLSRRPESAVQGLAEFDVSLREAGAF